MLQSEVESIHDAEVEYESLNKIRWSSQAMCAIYLRVVRKKRQIAKHKPTSNCILPMTREIS